MFPSQVNVQPAPAVAGDFCDAAPRTTVDAGPGGLVAGPLGLTVGRFAWTDPANLIASNSGAGAPAGFVHREQQALITQFLAEQTMIVPQGLGVTLFRGGGFWVKNDGAGAAVIGNKAYADNATGKVSFAATATPPAGGTSSASTVAANLTTGSSTLAANAITAGSIAGNVLTVASIAAGTVLAPGQVIGGGSAAVGFIDPATTILAQLTGTAGDVGTYQVSVSQTILSTAMTVTGGGLTIGTISTGRFYEGQTLSGTGIVTGTKITHAGTGTGGAGTYAIDTAPTPGSNIAVTGSGGTLTVGGTVTGQFSPGNVIHGSGVTSGSTILLGAGSPGALGLTGAGGAGTYIVSVGDTVGSEEIDVYSGTETKWYAASAGAAGELVKMTNIPLG